MNIINLENLTLIGQGSEWFWAMAQLIVVATSLAGVYWQLRASGAANALARISSIQRHWESKTMAYARLEAAIRLRYATGSGIDGGSKMIADFMDDLWALRSRGFIADDELIQTWGRPSYVWWELLRPDIEAQRQIEGALIDEDFERLARHSASRLAAAGVDLPPFDDSERRKWLDIAIKKGTAKLELIEAVESGFIPRPPRRGVSRKARGSS